MAVTAKISRTFLWRLGLIAAFFIGTCLWFLYDGAIGYPKYNKPADAYLELKKRKIEECGKKEFEELEEADRRDLRDEWD